MEEKTCPQCYRQIDKKARIYKDEVCGHSKCKLCLIQEDECKQCSLEVIEDHNYSNDQSVVVGFEIVQVETQQGPKFEVLSEGYEESQGDKEQYIEEEYLETQSEIEFPKDAGEHIKEETELIIVNDLNEKEDVPKKSRSYRIPTFIESITVKNDVTDENEHRYHCNICQKTFKSSHQIRYHQYCDDSLEKPYKCDQCELKYRTSYQLKQHQQLHSNIFYECPKCLRRFSHDASLKKHFKKHFQTTPPPKKPVPKGIFACQICDKIFSRSDYLKKHMICHEEQKRFKCEQCDRQYARNNALKFHILTAHTERQEFECNCGKTFSTMQSLARHQIVHSASKPLKCLVCGLRSSRKDNLFRHIRTFHTAIDPKSSIGIEEGVEENDEILIEDDVPMEETTTVIRSQEEFLRKNVIVMQKQATKEKQNAQNEEKPIVFQVEKQKSTENKPRSSIQNLTNIDIYRKILLPMTEEEQPEQADDDIEEYIEHLS